MTKQEFIGMATTAILVHEDDGTGRVPRDPDAHVAWASAVAEAALAAVGAWERDLFVRAMAARGCYNYTRGHNCKSSGRARGGRFYSDQWCDPCEATVMLDE